MKKFDNLLSLVGLGALVAAFTGCMTPVTVITDPPGATVYSRGSGRPSYQWEYRGSTKNGPVVFKVPYNAIKTRVCWPAENGKPAVQSEEVYTKLLFNDDPVIKFKK